VKPGKKATGELTVTNDEGEKINVVLSSKDWFVTPGNEKFKASEWLSFKQKEFPMEKDGVKTVQFFVEAPQGAKGELVGMLSIGVQPEIPTTLNKVLSVAMYVAIQGTEKLKAEVQAIMISPSSGTLTASLLLKNEGNVHVRPEGWFVIKNTKGQIIADITLEKGRPTYPGKENVYSGQVKDVQLKPDEYSAEIALNDVDRKIEIVRMTKKFEVTENNVVELK
jgi:hypothetical protein